MQAIILAAGLGKRIPKYSNIPKGFIHIGKDPIIVESINKLNECGIEDILIVTGHRYSFYEDLAKKRLGISTIYNAEYKTSGSLYSLYCAREWIKEDCLILESDLIYDVRAIHALCQAKQSTVILLSGLSYTNDEIYVEADDGRRLIRMSKVIDTLDIKRIYGEFVGINKITVADYRQLVQLVKDKTPLLYAGHYEETGLVALAKKRPVDCLKIPDLLWCEIDDLSHLRRAIKLHKAISTQPRQAKRSILLNPGPVTTTQTVKAALQLADICHRENEFTDLMRGIRNDLLSIVHAKEDYTAIPFTASGTGALEACISSILPSFKNVAIINNGAYGQRIIDIAKRYSIPFTEIAFAFDEHIDFSKIESIMSERSDIEALFVVHHETSSGVLNPLRELGALCYRFNCQLFVDAISSFAGTEIDVYKDHIDFLCASSNKCLHGMPGLSFVICHRERLLETAGSARSYYFDLHQQYEALENSGEMPFTPAVQIVYSLRQALNEFFIETLAGRMRRYHRNYDYMVEELRALGFDIVTPRSMQSKLLAVVRFPDDGVQYEFDALHDYLYKKGYTIYPKKIAIDNTFRLACIGHLDQTDITHFLIALKAYMQSMTRKHKDLV